MQDSFRGGASGPDGGGGAQPPDAARSSRSPADQGGGAPSFTRSAPNPAASRATGRPLRAAVVGGGPAGLYFALLLKKQHPDARVTVIERNRADDTFGFGVVFSDQTLDAFERHDPESYRAITERFAYWDDVAIHFKGAVHRVGGNGFCGCSRRTLLLLLQDRARALGVDLLFSEEAADLEGLMASHDLVVAADGINSAARARFAEHFAPRTDLRPNRFAWMGSTRPFDAFTFFFKEVPQGRFIAHCYQYEPGASTWVLETDPATFERAGLDSMNEQQSAAFMEEVFAEELEGHRLVTNRSLWRQFPMIRCERWTKNNLVLLGDAKATAHFSIGSGTKLAMEDAIALSEAFRHAGPDVPAALHRFETSRREEVEKTQHAADVSLVWFEHLERFWHFDPTVFAFGLMTRAKAITYDNLDLRAPDFVAAATEAFAATVPTPKTLRDGAPAAPMFQPLTLRGLTIPNRVVVSPMDQYSAVDGVPGDWHLMHYGSRATGGAGLVFTEMACVSEEGRITPGCTGIWTDAQEEGWRRVVDFVHAHSGAKIALQLGHSGGKGATKLMWEGIDQPLESGAWDVMAASPLPYYPHSPVPREATRQDMDRVREEFVAAARRAERCGFDLLELHCAHGYLLAGFLSPLTNRRADEYGGSLDNRLRFPLEVFRAMREVWPAGKPMSVRISATDWKEGGMTGEESIEVARAFKHAGLDLIDVSTGQTVHDAKPSYGRMFQLSYADAIRNEAGLATMCVGAITSADQVNTILAAGRADLVALGRPHLLDPFFTAKAAAWYGVKDEACPPQYRPGRDQALRNLERERQDLKDLKLKARPKSRGAPPPDAVPLEAARPLAAE